MRTIGILLVVILVIVGGAFAALNAEKVALNYLIGTKEIRLSVILLFSLTFGVLVTALALGFSLIKLKAKNKWLESRLKKTQDQLAHSQH